MDLNNNIRKDIAPIVISPLPKTIIRPWESNTNQPKVSQEHSSESISKTATLSRHFAANDTQSDSFSQRVNTGMKQTANDTISHTKTTEMSHSDNFKKMIYTTINHSVEGSLGIKSPPTRKLQSFDDDRLQVSKYSLPKTANRCSTLHYLPSASDSVHNPLDPPNQQIYTASSTHAHHSQTYEVSKLHSNLLQKFCHVSRPSDVSAIWINSLLQSYLLQINMASTTDQQVGVIKNTSDMLQTYIHLNQQLCGEASYVPEMINTSRLPKEDTANSLPSSSPSMIPSTSDENATEALSPPTRKSDPFQNNQITPRACRPPLHTPDTGYVSRSPTSSDSDSSSPLSDQKNRSDVKPCFVSPPSRQESISCGMDNNIETTRKMEKTISSAFDNTVIFSPSIPVLKQNKTAVDIAKSASASSQSMIQQMAPFNQVFANTMFHLTQLQGNFVSLPAKEQSSTFLHHVYNDSIKAKAFSENKPHSLNKHHNITTQKNPYILQHTVPNNLQEHQATKFLPPVSRAILEQWYQANSSCPYADDSVADDLAARSGISRIRVLKWLSNRRNRDGNTKKTVGRRRKSEYKRPKPYSL